MYIHNSSLEEKAMVFQNCVSVNQNIFEPTVCFSKQANTKGREKKKIETSMLHTTCYQPQSICLPKHR